MMSRILVGSVSCCMLVFSGCEKEEPRPAPAQPPFMPVAAPTTPATTPATTPVAAQPQQLPPVAPGSYTNHIGNPAYGHWGPDGQWVWKNPESEEANDTWKFLAAAGAGAAGGAALSMLMSKKHFEQRNPDGQWRPENNRHDEHSYRDRRGNPISKEEYERRKAQSERDKARHREQQRAAQESKRLEQQRQQSYQQRTQSRNPAKRWKNRRRRR